MLADVGGKLRKEQETLLRTLLRQSRAVKSDELAQELGCSTRSIKNYVKQVNGLSEQIIIYSSKDGYLINRRLALGLLDQQEGSPLPQSHTERARYIIKRLALEHGSSLNVFDLCEELYISLSTLRSDVRKMNLTYERFDVSFRSQENKLELAGSEHAKRRLFGYALFEEAGGFISIAALRECFSPDDVEAVSASLDETMSSHACRINEISRNNLLMHLLILISRVREGAVLQGGPEEQGMYQEEERTRFLCDSLSRSFSIELGREDRLEVQMLLKAYTNPTANQDRKDLEGVIGGQMVEEIGEMVSAVAQYYDVNLCTDSLLMPLCLHIKGLIERGREGFFAKNPLAPTIREEYPLVYDIGTNLAIRIAHRYDLALTEDETAFIAIHVGAELERQRLEDSRVKAALICPDYHGMADGLAEQIEHEYSESLEIVAVASDEMGVEGLSFDLLITTIPVDEAAYPRVARVAPLGRGLDLGDVISEIRHERELQTLEEHFEDYLSEPLFFPQVERVPREQVITLLCSRLRELGYVDEFFDVDVLQRENASSTSYGAIAIPHAASMTSNKTCIAVATSNEGIPWGPSTVHLVLLFAMSDTDMGIFRKLYEAMIGLLSEPCAVEALSRSESFEEFDKEIMRLTRESG